MSANTDPVLAALPAEVRERVERTLASYGTEAGPAESSNLFPEIPLPGEVVTAPPLPKLGGPEDPGRMVKDWNFYKYRPHHPLSSSLNRYGPDFRWPGLNNTPEIRHHLAIIKRPAPKQKLNPLIWTDLPRMEPGPGHDHIAKRYEADLELDAQRVEGFRHHRLSVKEGLAVATARREALQLRAFTQPSPGSRMGRGLETR